MKTNKFMKSLNRGVRGFGMKFKKHSPEILLTFGVAGVVVSGVMACKATTKLEKVLEKPKEDLEKINEYVEENGYSEEYTEEDNMKDVTITYAKGAVEVAKLYAPSVILGSLSLAAIVGGHKILKKRNVAIAAAYTIVDRSFKNYRSRVVEKFGKELDKELRFNIKDKEVIERFIDEETGEEKEETRIVRCSDIDEYSEYARHFDDGCKGWRKDAEYNLLFLRKQQAYANDLLQLRGYVFLNEVYAMLGIKPTKAGQIVGWVYDESSDRGDNYIDFGIYDPNHERARAFVNGYERTILLDFNVDGNILDLI